MISLEAHHVAYLLAELGTGCRLDAKQLGHELQEAILLFERGLRWRRMPTAAKVQTEIEKSLRPHSALLAALDMPGCPLDPELAARVREAASIELALAAYRDDVALAEIRDEKHGQRGGDVERTLIENLGVTFFRATGKRPTVSDFKAKIGEEAHGGHFLRFARAFLAIAGVQMPAGMISKYVQRPAYRARFSTEDFSRGYPSNEGVDIETVTFNDEVTDDDDRNPRRPDRAGG